MAANAARNGRGKMKLQQAAAPQRWELLEFVVQPVVVRRNADGEITEKMRLPAVEVGGVKLLAQAADDFPLRLAEFNATWQDGMLAEVAE